MILAGRRRHPAGACTGPRGCTRCRLPSSTGDPNPAASPGGGPLRRLSPRGPARPPSAPSRALSSFPSADAPPPPAPPGGGGGAGPPPPAQVWDIRAPQRELAVLAGHTYAVRRVLFSPHSETVLASASYDMTVRLWDWAAPGDALLRLWDHHTEFAVGLDFSPLVEGLLASCGWDELTYVWRADGDPRAG